MYGAETCILCLCVAYVYVFMCVCACEHARGIVRGCSGSAKDSSSQCISNGLYSTLTWIETFPYTILIRCSIHVMRIVDTYTVISGLTILHS